MKLNTPLILLALTATTSLSLTSSTTKKVNACVIVDTTTQVAIRGSRTPSQQENTITTGSDDNCFNNTVVGNTTQIGIGAGDKSNSLIKETIL